VRSDRWSVLVPPARAAALSGAALVGAAVAPDAVHAQTNHVNQLVRLDGGTALAAGVSRSASAIGDFDGDGDLDLVVTGYANKQGTLTLYENDGTGSFTVATDHTDGVFTGVFGGSVVAADFDGDSDLDLFVTGIAGYDHTATLYENDGSGSFSVATDHTEAGLEGVYNTAVSVGDFDGDGDLDLLVMGSDNNYNYITTVYENTGQNGGSGTIDGTTFQDVGAGLTGGTSGLTSAGDFDGDGDLDLFVAGDTYSSGAFATIYENTAQNSGSLGAGTFAAVQSLTPVYSGSSSIGDFDGDGDLDLLVTGFENFDAVAATLYENTGQNGGAGSLDGTTFQPAGAGLRGVGYSATAVADVGGDGDLELIVTGYSVESPNPTTTIYVNVGSLNFNPFSDDFFTRVRDGSLSVGDLDGDGDTDVVVTGGDESGTRTATVHDNTSAARLTITGAAGADGTDAGWRMVSFPAPITLGEIEDDFGFDFQTGLASGNVAYVWDAIAQQWDPLENDDDVIEAGQGVLLFLFDDADDPIEPEPNGLEIVTTGVDDRDSDVTLEGLGTGQFVFIGNPYTRAYDLTDLNLDGTDFSQVVQVYDPATETFDLLTRGADPVAAMQGFVIQRNQPGQGPTSLTFGTDGILPGPGTFRGTGVPAPESEAKTVPTTAIDLALTVERDGHTVARDNARVFFHPDAAAGWDPYEATQLLPPEVDVYATLTSPVLRDGALVRRTQAARPRTDDPVQLPLSVAAVGADGTATLALDGPLPDAWTVELEDTATGTRVDLSAGGYAFALADGDGEIAAPEESRFVLHVTPEAALPVELTGFDARQDGEGALLTWTTAAEQNNAGFEVHRMIGDDGMFEVLGFVEGAGTTSRRQAYRFRTDRLPAGTHRFRLKQLDTDGSAEFSPTISVEVTLAETYRLTAPSPHPARDGAVVHLTVEQAQRVRVSVYDVLGREVELLVEDVLAPQTEHPIRVGDDLPAGTYFIRVAGERFTATERLVVVR
jgi:hypothetical protein